MDRAEKQLVSNLRYINKGLQRENKKLRADLETARRQVMEWSVAATKIREVLDYMSKEGE